MDEEDFKCVQNTKIAIILLLKKFHENFHYRTFSLGWSTGMQNYALGHQESLTIKALKYFYVNQATKCFFFNLLSS